MTAWRLVTFIAIAGIAVVFQLFFKDSNVTDFAGQPTPATEKYLKICTKISQAISNQSAVYYPGSPQYVEDNAHWIPTASEVSACSVEPGSVADVQAILTILGNTTTPFGIKSGGYTFNQGWSSTTGVQIALSRFNEVTYDANSSSVTLGMGNTWNKIFAVLEQQNVTVSGGRIDGVGIGGFLLGGGYSYLTDKSGLSMDNVLSYTVVLPNATVVTASSSSNPDLFWGLKGGFNNFGIVTSAVVKAYPIGQVYGGKMIYQEESLPLLALAIEAFTVMQNSSDAVTDGGIIMAYVISPGAPPSATVELFYNGEQPPERMLAPFKYIPGDNSTLGIYNLTSLIKVCSGIFENKGGLRAASSTASVYQITAPIILKFWEVIKNLDAKFTGSQAAVVMFEPFIPTSILRPLTDGLFPHAFFASPLNAALWWTDPTQDAAGLQALDAATTQFEAILQAAGQPVDDMMLYPNYADKSHTVEQLYGPNLQRAIALRAQIDPEGVMLRTGGWKLVQTNQD